MKRLLTFGTMIMCSVLSALAQFSGSGSGTQSDPYLIRNAAQLSHMANFCGQNGVVFKLQKDIDVTDWLIDEGLTNQGWSPIGTSSQPFKGMLIGDNHKISGLFILRSSQSYVGFFGYTDGATINDLTIEGTTFTGSSYLGTMAGYALSSTFTNCHIIVSGNVSSASGNYVGGAFGYASDCTFTDSSVETVVNSSGAIYVGGFGGGAIDGTIISDVTANITVSSSNECAGGLLGYTNTVTITNTKVNGDVTGTSCVAGFIAKAEGTDIITNCTYRGDLNGDTNIGGISAYLSGGSSSTYSNCYMRGNIIASGENAGGIIGYSVGGCIASLESCCYYGNIYGNNYVGGIIGQICEQKNYYGSPIHLSYWDVNGRTDGFSSFASIRDKNKTGSFNIDLQYNVDVRNCIVCGNIVGKEYVGGMVGSELWGFNYTSVPVEVCYYNDGYPSRHRGGELTYYSGYTTGYIHTDIYLLQDDNYTGIHVGGSPATFYFNYYIFYKRPVNLTLSNSVVTGFIKGDKCVGGIVGYKCGGIINNCLSNAIVCGESNVGGVLGISAGESIQNKTSLLSNIFNGYSITSSSNYGRIYSSVETEYANIGELGSSKSNRASTKTKVILNGVLQEVTDDLHNGTSIGPSALKTKANYQAWGWDFDNDWDIIDGESWPYKKYQAAPPSVESALVSQETTISGKSLNGGRVYLTYNDQEPIAINCEGDSWSVNMEPLQSGATVTIYAETDVLVPSYPVTYTVSPKGEGTKTDPYQIYTAYDLQGISKRGYYKLMNDIDLSAWILRHNPTGGWNPIGLTETPEMMHLDGDNHVIKGLWTNSTNTYNGLFANLSNGGSVKNLAIQVATGKKLQGGDFAGILAGYAVNLNVENCLVKGDVETANYAGGLIGYAKGGGINKCYSKGSVKATGENGYAGGIVAYCSTPVTDSYSTADVEAQECVAGLVGYSTSTIDRCYAQGNVAGLRLGAGLVAQLCGTSASITNSVALNENITMTGEYASASRVLNGNINGCPDPDESNLALKTMVVTINGKTEKKYDDEWEGTGKTLADLMLAAQYEALGWDFTNVWGIVENETVPYLLSEIKLGDVNRDGQIDMTDAVSIVYYYLGERPKVFVEETADINGDGRIDITDAIIIVYQYLGESGNGASARALLNKALDNEPQ